MSRMTASPVSNLSPKERRRRGIKSWVTRRKHGLDRPCWNKGLTMKSSKLRKCIEKATRTKRRRYKSGEIVAWNKGKKLSKEHCENLRKAHLGNKHSLATRRKMSTIRKGRKYSESWCRHISRGLKRSEKHAAARIRVLPIVFSKVAKHPNGLEKRMQKILKKMNLKYKFQYPVGRFVPDFLICKNGIKLIVETDGAYWHQNKRKQRRRDRALRKLGYTILHFSEDQVYKEPRVVASAVTEALEQK